MPTYRDRLRAHPGKGSATIMTGLGATAGLSGDTGSWGAAAVGALIMGGVFWGIVLWTARTQPVGDE